MSIHINEQTISLAHYRAIKTIMEHGYIVLTEDNELTTEMPSPLCIHVDEPLAEYRILKNVGLGKQFMEQYSLQMHTAGPTTFAYTYGNRLIDYGGIDQLQLAINKLNCSPPTRRAIMHTWMVPIDTKAEFVPCMQLIQFIRRPSINSTQDVVNAIAVFRSNDMLMAWGANAYAISEILRLVAEGTHCRVGFLETYSISAHVYHKRDESTLDEAMSRYVGM